MATRGELAKRIAEKAASRRSPLYVWLYENYADISRAMSRPRPSWTALAETAAEAVKVDDEKGTVPNAGSVRAAWLRVCRDMGKPHGTRQPTRRTRGATSQPAKSDHSASRPTADLETPDDPPPRLAFKPAKIR